MTFFLVGALFLPAHAQRPTVPRVYTYVEQMPQLPGGGGQGAIAMQLLKQVKWPVFTEQEFANWSRPVVTFVVGPEGKVDSARIVASSHIPSIDQALLVAAKSLPRFIPGYQQGQPVSVQLTFPVSCLKPQFK